jgi:hypothetical protein
MSEADEISERQHQHRLVQLRDEVARLKYLKEKAVRRWEDNVADTFNDLYYIVTSEYEKWDEGMTVDWEAVQHACSLMVSAIRRGQKEY